jgi:acyl carrier protein
MLLSREPQKDACVEIETEVKQFLAATFLPDATADSIAGDMPLITGGIVDSLGMLKLVDFIERRFQIEFMPREVDAYALDTVEQIAASIRRKLANPAQDPAAPRLP